MPLLLIEEALRLTLVGLALLGPTLCSHPGIWLHLLVLLLLVLLFFLKESTIKRRPSHYIHHLLVELVIILKVL